jgi:hypothetical protein
MLADYVGTTVYTDALVDLIVLHSNTGIATGISFQPSRGFIGTRRAVRAEGRAIPGRAVFYLSGAGTMSDRPPSAID